MYICLGYRDYTGLFPYFVALSQNVVICSVLLTVDGKSTNRPHSKCLIDGVCSVPQTCHLNSTDPV